MLQPTNQPDQPQGPNSPNTPYGDNPEPGFAVLIVPASRFELGQLVATPGALAALAAAHVSSAELIGRHLSGDWGTVDREDWAANERALLEGTRLLSAYELPVTGEKIWVITEWDRSATTLLLPSEY